MKSIKEFIKQSNEIIRKEKLKINELHKEISEYESVLTVISKNASNDILDFYKKKINECYLKIDAALDAIQHNKEIIVTMRTCNKIIKRGEKCA